MNRPDLDAITQKTLHAKSQLTDRKSGRGTPSVVLPCEDLLMLVDYARELEQRVRHLEMNLVVHVEMEHDAHAERIAELEAALEPFASAFHLNGIESIRWSPTLLHFKDAAQVLNK